MNYYAYLFEAHSIQPYILSSGKLRDMVGASEMLERLLGEPLNLALAELGLAVGSDADCEFSRRGGAAFILVFKDRGKALALRDLWGLMVKGIAPGLAFRHIVSDAGESPSQAYTAARGGLEHLRLQQEISLPVAGPLVRRSPRTGQPAVNQHVREEQGNTPPTKEWVDEATEHKRFFGSAPTLESKFLDEEERELYLFPLDTDTDFPTKDATRYVGILHADGNGLGNIVRDLVADLAGKPNEYAKTFREFSELVNQATCDAAKEALRPILKATKPGDYLPFRPLVLGGDDLTVIVRADFAIKYAEDFLTAFEAKTAEYLGKFGGSSVIPKGLTACAGIAFIKINQPFSMGYRLAESLCEHAKAESKDIQKWHQQTMTPSSLAFHRVTSSLIESYPDLLQRELTASDGNNHYRLTLGAYGVGKYAQGLPALESLTGMKTLFSNERMSRGLMRHFMTLLHESIPEANKIYSRWRHNMEKDAELTMIYQSYRQQLDALLGTGERNPDLPFAEAGKDREVQLWKSFLVDLSNWMAVEGETHA